MKSRDFTHVDDVVSGIMKLLTNPKKPKQAHFGSSHPYNILEIADAFDHYILTNLTSLERQRILFVKTPI
jgi:nucleoside-diphosphate-sugar epimerase